MFIILTTSIVKIQASAVLGKKKKLAASSMLHETKIAYYAFDAAIFFASSIGPVVAKAT